MARKRLIDRRERHVIRVERLVVAAGVEKHRAEVEVRVQKRAIEISRLSIRGDRFVFAAECNERVAQAELVLRIVRSKLRGLCNRGERIVVAIQRTEDGRAKRVERGIAGRFRDRPVDILQRVGRSSQLLRGRGRVEKQRAVRRRGHNAEHERLIRLGRFPLLEVERAEVDVRRRERRRDFDDAAVFRDRVVDAIRVARALRVFHERSRDLGNVFLCAQNRREDRQRDHCGREEMSHQTFAIAAAIERKTPKPSVLPSSASAHRSGCGIIPSTLRPALQMPAMLRAEPFGFASRVTRPSASQ